MSRRNRAVRRPVPPDPRYDSQTVSKFICNLMNEGNKGLAERIVITEPSCYEGIEGVEAPMVVAVQDVAEHGVHAMYLEVTDDPLFYGPVVFRC